MIRLHDVTKYYGWGRETKLVLDGIDRELDTSSSIGILGMNGAGKSTLVNIIAGALPPTSGYVERHVRVSWPLGLKGFVGGLTGEENIRFISRIYGADRRKVFRFVQDFSELGDDLFRPIETYSSGMKSRLTVGVSMAIDFDVYLMDEGLSVADRRFTKRYSDVMNQRLDRSSLIIVSHNMNTVSRYCTRAAVLHGGKLSTVMPLHEAASLYNRLADRGADFQP
jgi:capsular polysaccharide transport system ATP-binding protein